MEKNNTFGEIITIGADGTERVVANLDLDEYFALAREMQWSEDLDKWDEATRLALGFGLKSKI